MHGGDRNRTSPFAFTGNKFEFRAVGSSASLAFPNTVLSTMVAEAIDDLADKLEAKGTDDVAAAVAEVVGESYSSNKAICFMGDNYDEAWHAEAEGRGLKNLRTTPDALPEILSGPTVEVFAKYKVLSERELSSRFEVWTEQYVIRANIEAETAESIAKTMILPAALRYLALGDDSGISAVKPGNMAWAFTPSHAGTDRIRSAWPRLSASTISLAARSASIERPGRESLTLNHAYSLRCCPLNKA